MDTTAGRGATPPAPSASREGEASALPSSPPKKRRRRSLALDLTMLGVVCVLLVAASAAAFGAIQREFYSPTAFVERYLAMLSG